MKKMLILTAVFLCGVSCLKAQVAFYDAKDLGTYVDSTGKHFKSDPGSLKSVCSILLKYYPGLGKNPDYHAVINAIEAPASPNFNPFIAPYFTGIVVPLGAGNISPAASFLGGFGNTNVTNLADAIAKFLVERAKEELYIAFFEKLKIRVNNDYPELRVLFPNSVTLLNNIEAVDFSNVIMTLREALDKDLGNMLGNIINLNDSMNINATLYVQNDPGKELKKFFDSQEGKLFLAAIRISNGFLTGQKVPDIFNSVSSYLLQAKYGDADFQNSLKLFMILNSSIRNADPGKNYVSLSDLNAFWTGATANRSMFLGLIYAQVKNAKIVINSNDISAIFGANPAGLEDYLTKFTEQSSELITAITNRSSAAIFESANNFLTAAADLRKLDARIIIPDNLKLIFGYTNQTLGIAHDIAIKNYNAAIVGTLNLASSIINSAKPPNTTIATVLQEFVKYYSFTANVVAATNSTEIKNAIDAIALPVGSYSIKRESRFNLALQGYLGGFAGMEYMPALKQQKTSFTYGISAPVGIAFSWGKKFESAKHGGNSLTIFIPIIDVGAMAAFRVKDDSSAYSSEVQLKNIVAPGLYLYWGFARCPLSVGIGGQLGPQLRSISAKNSNVDDNYYIRFAINVVIDIPIINLYNKKDKLESKKK